MITAAKDIAVNANNKLEWFTVVSSAEQHPTAVHYWVNIYYYKHQILYSTKHSSFCGCSIKHATSDLLHCSYAISFNTIETSWCCAI